MFFQTKGFAEMESVYAFSFGLSSYMKTSLRRGNQFFERLSEYREVAFFEEVCVPMGFQPQGFFVQQFLITFSSTDTLERSSSVRLCILNNKESL